MARTIVKGPLAFTAANNTELETFDSSFIDLRGNGPGFAEIQGNRLTHTFGAAVIFPYRDGTPTYSGDQYGKVTLASLAAGFPNARYGIAGRMSADTGPNDDWYAVVVDISTNPWNTRVYKCVNGSVSTLDSRTSLLWVDTDTLAAEFVANGANCDIKVYRNDVLAYTITDAISPLTGGKPGLYLFDNGGGGNIFLDDAEFGDVTADATPPDITSTGTGSTNGPFAANLAENSTAAFITLTANENVTWGSLGGADAALFQKMTEAATTVQLRAVSGFNFESLPHANPFVVTIAATDGASNARTVTVNATVTNVNEPPNAPTIGTATAGNASASVAFTPGAANGGPSTTGYTATSSPGGITGTGASSPITVSGITNGVAYTFTVTATNSEGTSSPSAASNSVTPTAPGDSTPPTLTGSVTVTNFANGSGTFDADWPDGTDNVAVTQWRVRAVINGTPGAWSVVGSSSVSGSGLTPGLSTTIEAQAGDAANNWSSTITSASFVPGVAPSFSVHPASGTYADGATVDLTATSSGTPTPTYQWQRSTNGGGAWSDISGATSAGYTFTAAFAETGYQYRRRDSNAVQANVASNAATITVTAAAATTASFLLTTDGTTPAANLSGLKFAFFDEATPNLWTAPKLKGTNGSTNGSGIMTLNITGVTGLAPGAIGSVVATNSDGSTSQGASLRFTFKCVAVS